MKLHDLRPADGSRRPRTRVGRGIAAGKGKTAGRGTKGQRSRAGASIPPWFEGGQTPLSMRIPKLRGFKNRFKVDFEVVNVGRIAALVADGRLEADPHTAKAAKGAKSAAPITVNQEILRATGLVSTLNKPLKVLGAGDVDVPLFVVADAFSASARTKIEAAGGTVQVLQIPTGPLAAIGVEGPAETPATEQPATEKPATEQPAAEAAADVRPQRSGRSKKADTPVAAAAAATAPEAPEATEAPEPPAAPSEAEADAEAGSPTTGAEPAVDAVATEEAPADATADAADAADATADAADAADPAQTDDDAEPGA